MAATVPAIKHLRKASITVASCTSCKPVEEFQSQERRRDLAMNSARALASLLVWPCNVWRDGWMEGRKEGILG